MAKRLDFRCHFRLSAWVTRPERPKSTKDDVKGSKGLQLGVGPRKYKNAQNARKKKEFLFFDGILEMLLFPGYQK